MKRKYSYRKLNSLWEKKLPTKLALTFGSAESYYKKSMDDICFKAELSESPVEYAEAISEGMLHLFKLGVPVDQIRKHHNLMHKLIYFGRDLMECNRGFKELFYLGIFIELKIIDSWKNIKFFQFIKDALKLIKKELSFISNKLKERLEKELQQTNGKLYGQYFSMTPIVA